MAQKRKHSLMETLTSTFIGYVLAYVTTLLVFPLFGWEISASKSFWITNIFTVLSILRGYGVRRLFNWLYLKGILT